jgi:hypothetical protein
LGSKFRYDRLREISQAKPAKIQRMLGEAPDVVIESTEDRQRVIRAVLPNSE